MLLMVDRKFSTYLDGISKGRGAERANDQADHKPFTLEDLCDLNHCSRENLFFHLLITCQSYHLRQYLLL